MRGRGHLRPIGSEQRIVRAFVDRHAGEDAAELAQRFTDANAALVHAEFANGALVDAAAFLHHRDRLPHFAPGFEVAQQDHGVGEVAGIHRRVHLRADDAVMRANQQRRHALLRQVHQHLVQLDGEEALLGHGVEVAVEAVDDDDLDAVAFDGLANLVRELARRQFRRIDLHQLDQAGLDLVFQIDAERRCSA